MPDHPRIEELRRRVQKDPASIAFAQLAEEYRRSGNYEDAISICRVGLRTHPSYLSARVTLGRSLVEMHDLDAAAAELTFVLDHAPENLAAMRAMAEIHHRRGELTEALAFHKTALELARHDPDLEQTVAEISRTVSKPPAAPAPSEVPPPPAAPAATDPPLSEDVTDDFLARTFDLLDQPVLARPRVPPSTVEEINATELPAAAAEPVMPLPSGPLLALERFLDAIHAYRRRIAV